MTKNPPAAAPRLPADLFTGLRVSFDPKWLPRLAVFMAKSDIRYYLNGVYIERAPKGVYLVACDGHTLLAIHDATGTWDWPEQPQAASTIVRVAPGAITAARAAARANPSPRDVLPPARVNVRGSRLSVASEWRDDGTAHDGELFVQPGPCHIEGKFPDWRGVLPPFAELVGGVHKDGGKFNSHYLARLEKVAGKARWGAGAVALWHHPAQPIKLVAQFLDQPEMVALIMGMAVDADPAKFPGFARVDPPTEPSKQAEAVPA